MISLENWVDIRSLYTQGYSIRKIAQELGISRNTVRKALRETQSPRYIPRKVRTSKLDAYKDYVKARVEEHPGLSAVRLLEEIQRQGYSGKISILRDFLHPLRRDLHRDLTLRFETLPGQQGQVDWGSFGKVVQEGHLAPLYGFVFVLGYSRALYVEFTTSQILESLLACHLHAFDYLGGYPREILYDHIKTVILSEGADGQDRHWNPRFMDFAGYYGFVPRLCRPYRARTKGKVERMIGYVKNNFFEGREFGGLEDLNHQALVWCDTVANVRVHATTGAVPLERLPQEGLLSHRERPPYDISEVVARKVTRDCYVSFKGNFYSVPWPYGGKAITLRATPEGLLEIWAEGTQVGSHRLQVHKGQVITDRSHFQGLEAPDRPSGISPQKIVPFQENGLYVPEMSIPQVQQRPLSVYEQLIPP